MPQAIIPASKLKLLGDAVNGACDKLDGIADGVIDDPRMCTFDAKELQCKTGQEEASCLTPKQAQTVNDIWKGSQTSRGKQIYPGYALGAEAASNGWVSYKTGTGTHWEQGMNTLKYIVFENPQWKRGDFNVERDAAFAKNKVGRIMDAYDPDLSRFAARGGKLLMYHGWNDPSISPFNTINYYEKVMASMKKGRNAQGALARIQEFARLFMAPGMLHCAGGPGPNSFDMLTELEQWVENNQPPERIIASRSTNGVVDRTRPLCAYPKVAVHTGSGNTDDAANFVCRDGR